MAKELQITEVTVSQIDRVVGL